MGHAHHHSAPGLEEAEYQLSRAAFRGVRGFDLGSNDVKGVPMPTLRGYGLRDPLLDLIRRWKTVSATLNADQRKALDVFTRPDRQRMAFEMDSTRGLTGSGGWRMSKSVRGRLWATGISPNGEVAWRLRSWGWRSDTGKSFRYDQVRAISRGPSPVTARAAGRTPWA